MDKKKNIIIAIIVLIFTVITVVTIILSNNNKNEIIINTEIKRLSDTNEFFSVQKNINKRNHDLLFHAEKIYYNLDNTLTYYFVSGYEISNFGGNKIHNNNYLVIVKNKKYTVKELGDNIDIEEFANNYDINNIEIDSTDIFDEDSISEKSKLNSYLSEFRNLLGYNLKKAYSRLGDKSLEKYVSYELFMNDVNNIFDISSYVVFGYSKIVENDKTIYKIRDSKQRNIEIIEYYPNDYKINF